MKLVFMGTPDFAVGALEALIQAGHEITAVVTQPDKPKGRGKEMQMTPVKMCALKYNIPVLQPLKIKTPEAIAELKQYEADAFIVAAFGQLLSEEILNMPKFGCINIHASLLPGYRGAAPIQWVILNGETQTGVTIMQMDKGLDTGDMLLSRSIPISPRETGESLHDKLSALGAELIVEALPLLEAGELVPVKQDDAECPYQVNVYAKMLNKALGHIDWNADAVSIERLIRGLNSWPSAYTYLGEKQLKIWEAQLINADAEGYAPGQITEIAKEAFCIQTGKGQICVTALQLEGKKRMYVHDFLLGYKLNLGDQLEMITDK